MHNYENIIVCICIVIACMYVYYVDIRETHIQFRLIVCAYCWMQDTE